MTYFFSYSQHPSYTEPTHVFKERAFSVGNFAVPYLEPTSTVPQNNIHLSTERTASFPYLDSSPTISHKILNQQQSIEYIPSIVSPYMEPSPKISHKTSQNQLPHENVTKSTSLDIDVSPYMEPSPTISRKTSDQLSHENVTKSTSLDIDVSPYMEPSPTISRKTSNLPSHENVTKSTSLDIDISPYMEPSPTISHKTSDQPSHENVTKSTSLETDVSAYMEPSPIFLPKNIASVTKSLSLTDPTSKPITPPTPKQPLQTKLSMNSTVSDASSTSFIYISPEVNKFLFYSDITC